MNNKTPKKKRELIIISHPDDEVLGCGGYLSKFKNKKIFKILFIGEGTSCRYSKNDSKNNVKKKIIERQKQSIQSLKYLGIKNFEYFNLPCGRFDQIDILDINKIIEREISIFKPETIFTHSFDDCNNDHKIVNRSVMMATRPSYKNKFLKKIITIEILSSTEWQFESQFSPNYFEKLSIKNVKDKIKAFYFYKSEVQNKQMPRTSDGIRTLAKLRGKIINSDYAESFKIVRTVND